MRSLFILAMREETLRSMVRSPTSTTSPPIMSELTSLVTLSFLPWPTYWDLETAVSRRDSVLLSRGCASHLRRQPARPAQTESGGKDGKRTWALVTLSSTSPRAALMMVPNFSQTPFRRPRRLFSASVLRKFLTVSPPAPACLASSATMAALSSAVRVGAARICDSLASFSTMALRLLRALAVGSRVEVLAAAVY